MGAQRLGPKKLRKIEQTVGEEIVAGWAHGGYIHYFVTPDHRHGALDIKTGEWEFYEPFAHYTSCFERWPDTDPRPNR